MSEFSEKMNESFVFYASFFEAIEGLPAKDQLKMYQTIAKYALKGEENELKQSLKNLWVLIRPQIIASQKRRCNGKNGGAPVGNANAKKQPMVDFENNQRLSEKQPNNNVNVNDNGNDNGNDNKTPHTHRERWDTALEENEAFRSLPDRARNAAREWLCYKREKRQGYTERGLRSFMTEFANRVKEYGESAVCGLVNECMANNWRGIIWDKLARGEPRAGGAQLVKNPAGGFDLK